MGTEVLHPQNCLINQFRASPVIVPNRRKNYTGNRKLQPRKRSPEKTVSPPRRSRSTGDDSYAGSAVFQSPSPRSVPLPSFVNRKQVSGTGDYSFDDSATKHLRRLLRLD